MNANLIYNSIDGRVYRGGIDFYKVVIAFLFYVVATVVPSFVIYLKDSKTIVSLLRGLFINSSASRRGQQKT